MRSRSIRECHTVGLLAVYPRVEGHIADRVRIGFAVVGAYQDSAISDAQATAYEQMLKWIQEH